MSELVGAAKVNPLAAHTHLPSFITAPGDTDVLMVVMGVILVLVVMMFGIIFFRIHTLPERMAHRGHKLQFEIVAVLGLLALLTHMHIFWVAGLLLAMIDIPDFGGSLARIAGSAERIAGIEPGAGAGPDDIPGPKEHQTTVQQAQTVSPVAKLQHLHPKGPTDAAGSQYKRQDVTNA
jgi:hypothetical protein